MATPTIVILGDDPETTHRLNACAYQQSAIATFDGIQYAAFYTTHEASQARRVAIARHSVQDTLSDWQYLTFDDYDQTVDDGHNTISIGICAGDGTIHVSFDHHCDTLKYRISRPGLANDPSNSSWSVTSFSPIQDHLPGCDRLVDVTYPRFIPGGQQMFFECRVGKAGAGSDVLYRYDPDIARFASVGTYLVGEQCNPYPNGLSFHLETNSLHVTWTNRHFIEYEGAVDSASTAHKAQAGPNGPENNEGLYHAYSRNYGASWNSSSHQKVSVLSAERGLNSQDMRLRVKDIPRDSGIMNQEAQYIDANGGVHVLNRENTGGKESWMHYYRSPSDGWSFFALPDVYPTPTGPRGKVVYVAKCDSVFFVLPSNTGRELIFARRRMAGTNQELEVVWKGPEYTGEPLVDEEALHLGILSILILKEIEGKRKIVVLQFDVNRLAT
ncbi:dockerin type 1 [Aspergillus heteromorphus CBS 117.55]|uniref:Dockerin type 1 n=1 Tax=Aspergillus heteromorphus CBS 117.55 TaxID=1448321 RepID=A0A317VM94_9EURO|nr:dockerin type 1 [Aspergillus heteromorphus CBS 117.55]PWY75494.1 dockerin type 1 [Aspergillus heteromorphus CBS 117.55]